MLLVTLTLFVILTVMEFVIELVTELVNEVVIEIEPEEVEEGMNVVEVVMVTEVEMKTVGPGIVLLCEPPVKVRELDTDPALLEMEMDTDSGEAEIELVMETVMLMDRPQSFRTRALAESATMTVGSVVDAVPKTEASTSKGPLAEF